ncbi:hypothetical protein GCM10008983_07100 [Lentibacillus halophilus]|uniref:Uncharacterized protein n=1 Tax=Lentibacillus halophilus TaxID=295065 RepID=A0ABP3IYS6_9BACI
MKKRMWEIIIAIVGMIVVIGFFIPAETTPSADTRIILEHTKKTYIAPPCFKQSNPTNNLADSTLGEANELNYKANGTCTKNAFKSEDDSLLMNLFKNMGIVAKKWDDW